MYVGSKVKIKETGERGTVIYKNRETIHVQLEDGRIEKVTTDAVSIIMAIGRIVNAVKGLVNLIKGIFKKG